MNTISEIQLSDSDQSIDTEDNENDSMDWGNLHDTVITSEDSDSNDTDGTEWLDDSFYDHTHTISNLEYTNLKLSNFAVKPISNEPITAIFDTDATCLCISQQISMEISDKSQYDQETFKSEYYKWTYIKTNWDSPIRIEHRWPQFCT